MMNIKKIISAFLIIAITCSHCAFAVNTNSIAEDTNSITIYLEAETRSNYSSGFDSPDVISFFEDNELNIEYYRNWIYSENFEEIQAVKFTVGPKCLEDTPATSNTDIQGSRIIYVDMITSITPRNVQLAVGELLSDVVRNVVYSVIETFSQPIGTLVSILDIGNPDTYFGDDRVRQGQEYYIHDGASRVVTKFVELYAPTLGELQWYVWGYAESEYIRDGVQLYYKGLEDGEKQNVYHQCYTENYYSEATLIELVKQAYSMGFDYCEAANEFSAQYNGYELYTREITREQYLEYDDVVIN